MNSTMKKYLLILLLICASGLRAQQFEVTSFRLLDNDITAWIDPVRDLNDEACALIKVANGRNYEFTSPLGIVKRVEKTGETWVYLPHGSQRITIKHPQWGVLRDYQFKKSLESRMSYEMILAPRHDIRREATLNTPIRIADSLRTQVIVVEKPGQKREKEPIFVPVLLTADIGTGIVAPGVRVGVARRHGVYLLAASNFVSGSSAGTCNATGTLTDGSGTPYYRPGTDVAYWVAQAGCLHRLAGRFYLYEGLGYGSKTVLWTTVEGEKIKNEEKSQKGIAAEVGGMYRIGPWAVSAGVSSIKAKVWTATVGIGYTF